MIEKRIELDLSLLILKKTAIKQLIEVNYGQLPKT